MQNHTFQMSNTTVCLQPESKAVCTLHICWEPVTIETVGGFPKPDQMVFQMCRICLLKGNIRD